MERIDGLFHKLAPGKEGKEIEKKLLLAQTVFDSVRSAYLNHLDMGDSGKVLISEEGVDGVNDHLRADIESEEKMAEKIDDWGRKENIKVITRGEEIGNRIIGDTKSTIESFCVLDGLDGTSNYKKRGDWPYGAMISVALNGDPAYSEFDVGAVGLFEEGLCLIGVKDVGVFVISLQDGVDTKLEVFDELEEFDYSLVLADDYFEAAKNYIGEHAANWTRTGSTAATLAAIAIDGVMKNEMFPVMDRGWQALVDVGRKGMLEWPAVYLIIKLLGGHVVDENGNDIGDRKFSKFSQKKDWTEKQGGDMHEPIVVAKNKRILGRIKELVNKKNK